jgi:arsenate reductase
MAATSSSNAETQAVAIFHNPSCSKSRSALAVLNERSIEHDVVEYLRAPPSRDTLESIIAKLDEPVASLVRTTDRRFVELGLDPTAYGSPGAVIELLLAHPQLMQRPIIVMGDRAMIARTEDRLAEIIG